LERISTTETIAFEIEKNTAVSDSLIGNSPQMVEIYKSIAMLSHNKATVLITGESGTGKELVARAVHNMSMAKEEPFIALNCAAIPENLIESELMGYVKGSFTGAEKTKLGKLDIVGEGSLLLDEIAETPLEFQSKLLRLLQEREYYPIGSNVSKIFKGRIIAATNKNLKKAVEEKKFREDLYYRLNVVTIQIPPLKKHISDLEILIKHFIQKANKSMNTDISEITQEYYEDQYL
jgi:transcriptional regulator with PAS, ATPase and Fis domain